MRRASILTALLLALTLVPAHAGDGYRFPGDAHYSVSKEKMKDALACRRGKKISRHGAGALNGSGRKQPVLMVHGTGVTRRQTWSWNYWKALPQRGWEVCWVELPNFALSDIQVASEYVARAVQLMHRRAHERIDLLGHSQGGLHPRWAVKWFPSGRHVGDYIGLASPNHGTVVADQATQTQQCFESCWQMRTIAKFIAALNRGGNETPGHINYTNIYTTSDELVQPPGTQALQGGANYLLQDLCPGRPVDHASILGDFVTWKLVKDALTHAGPARANRALNEDSCMHDRMPGAGEQPDGLSDVADLTQGNHTDHEPRLKPYARPN